MAHMGSQSRTSQLLDALALSSTRCRSSTLETRKGDDAERGKVHSIVQDANGAYVLLVPAIFTSRLTLSTANGNVIISFSLANDLS